MLENITDLSSIRLEGNHEDIELLLCDDSYIFAQAKSVVQSSSDFRNVRNNLNKSLCSLSEGCKNAKVSKLILITNSPNPLDDDASRSVFYGHSHRDFSSLPPSAQAIIRGYLARIDQPLNPELFAIQTLPFETDDDAERYKVVLQVINDFIGGLDINMSGLGKRLLEVWHLSVFTNGSKKDAAIQLTKKNVIWPIMVIATDVERIDDNEFAQFDIPLREEIVRRYREIIDSCCDRLEFFTRVLSDYRNFEVKNTGKDKCRDFVETTWKDYVYEFDVNGIEDEVKIGLTKIVLYNIIRRRFQIDRIKKGVNL